MLHKIDSDHLGPHGPPMSEAVSACVHCGFCLPTCPTYRELGQEMDSPRGRIYLMKEVLEGNMAADEARVHIDRCLGCLACVTSCPSGVAYHQLISPYRAFVSPRVKRTAVERFRRWLLLKTLPHPRRFRIAARAGILTRFLHPLAPAALRPMLRLLPESLPAPDPLPERIPASGTPRARVALLAGCVQQALNPRINRATIEVLTRNGVEVVVPPAQSCCGALAWHMGEAASARASARKALRAFPAAAEVDAVIVNAAGCGSGIHEYPLMLRGEPDEEAARAFAERAVDISVFLDRLGIEAPPPLEAPVRVAYHDACHLCHGQQVRSQPRNLLRKIPGLTLLELDDGEQCCGSAGTYNIDQPDLAANLGVRKAQVIRDSACDMVATGNIGCAVQIENHLGPTSVPVLHTMEILALAYAGTLSRAVANAGCDSKCGEWKG